MATRAKAKGRSDSKKFVQLFKDLLWNPNYLKLSPRAVKLFNDLLAQYNGNNNGDLSACRALMKDRGWNSASSLHLALRELEYYQFVRVSRQGGRNKPTLLTVTCFPIDECKGKHDLRPTAAATNEYKLTKKKWKPKRKQNPCSTGGSTWPSSGSMEVGNSAISPYVGQ